MPDIDLEINSQLVANLLIEVRDTLFMAYMRLTALDGQSEARQEVWLQIKRLEWMLQHIKVGPDKPGSANA